MIKKLGIYLNRNRNKKHVEKDHVITHKKKNIGKEKGSGYNCEIIAFMYNIETFDLLKLNKSIHVSLLTLSYIFY